MDTEKYILALDQGTTSSRAIIVDRRGQVVASSQRSFEQIFPRPGWVEHDASEIWYTQSSVAAEAVAKANLTGLDIACIGITNQRETTVIWDRETSLPVHNAIVWQDSRTAAYCEELKSKGKPEAVIEKIAPKIVEGRLGAFYKETVLLEQAYVKDPSKTVGDLFKEVGGTALSFARVEVGKGDAE